MPRISLAQRMASREQRKANASLLREQYLLGRKARAEHKRERRGLRGISRSPAEKRPDFPIFSNKGQLFHMRKAFKDAGVVLFSEAKKNVGKRGGYGKEWMNPKVRANLEKEIKRLILTSPEAENAIKRENLNDPKKFLEIVAKNRFAGIADGTARMQMAREYSIRTLNDALHKAKEAGNAANKIRELAKGERHTIIEINARDSFGQILTGISGNLEIMIYKLGRMEL